ncbi:hypothetical protein L1887_30449 [Cichorium endivia]|nr:hypothetical protein L1887_30449 [Cichorium endivia]
MEDDQIPALDPRQLKVLSAQGRGSRGVVFLVQDESTNGDLFAFKTNLRASITKKGKKTDNEGFLDRSLFESFEMDGNKDDVRALKFILNRLRVHLRRNSQIIVHNSTGDSSGVRRRTPATG